ncbi:MAG TPA: PaaI family thioesterase [Allosphingosinicella sp.]|nr:PaaI family thioesterase [Allosphingosinicella sp.]
MDVHPLIDHRPDADHPGWWSWAVKTEGRFNEVIGRLLVREAGPGRGQCRMFPEAGHSNLGDMVHGGAILTFIDMALFAGGRMAGADVTRAVTLDLSTRFLSPGRIGVPLDAEVELLRETGRLIFLDGRVTQDGELIASFTGALRKAARRP